MLYEWEVQPISSAGVNHMPISWLAESTESEPCMMLLRSTSNRRRENEHSSFGRASYGDWGP